MSARLTGRPHSYCTAPMTDTATRPAPDVVARVTAWLEDNWDPDLTVA